MERVPGNLTNDVGKQLFQVLVGYALCGRRKATA